MQPSLFSKGLLMFILIYICLSPYFIILFFLYFLLLFCFFFFFFFFFFHVSFFVYYMFVYVHFDLYLSISLFYNDRFFVCVIIILFVINFCKCIIWVIIH